MMNNKKMGSGYLPGLLGGHYGNAVNVLLLLMMLSGHAGAKTNEGVQPKQTRMMVGTNPFIANRGVEMLKSEKDNGGRQLVFTENRGQVKDQYANPRKDIDYALHTSAGLNIFIGSGAVHYQFYKNYNPQQLAGMSDRKRLPGMDKGAPSCYAMYRMDVELVGADRNAQVVAEQEQDYYENYIVPGSGNKCSVAHNYKRITYKDVYPHIDWVLYTSAGRLKHEFVVRLGGRVSDIKLKYGGATGISINKDGSLVANTPQGNVTEEAPYTYQRDGKKISSSFVLQGNMLSYETAGFSGDLVIDPSVAWATYYGSEAVDEASGVAVDATGNVYIAGYTRGYNDIASTGAYQIVHAGAGHEVVLARFTPAGVRSWSTFYGGADADKVWGIAVNSHGYIWLAGETSSTSGIATATGTEMKTVLEGSNDGFLARFNNAGQLEWATLVGGQNVDYGLSLAIDADDNMYMAGATGSAEGIATTGAHQTTHGANPTTNPDAFLIKFNSAGVRQWGTYYGGSNTDVPYGVAVDATGNVYMAGLTLSTNNIATAGAFRTAVQGNDGFLVKFNSAGVRQWGTYYGDLQYDIIRTVVTDGSGNVYITGTTTSTSGIATTGAGEHQSVIGGSGDAFLAKFSSAGTRLWGTYYGGAGYDDAYSVVADLSGNVYVAGYSNSTTGIATTGEYQTANAGLSDAFLVKFNSAGARQTATYFGGSQDEGLGFMTIDVAGNLYLFGNTYSTSGIATPGANKTIYNNSGDIYLAKFITTLPTTIWYSKATGILNDPATWGSNPDGTGTTPLNFTAAGMTYNIVNNPSPTFTVSWAPVGTVNVGNGISAVNFTITEPNTYTGGAINVKAGATLTIVNVIPVLGILSAGSTVAYAGNNGRWIASATYSNLTVISGKARGPFTVNGTLQVGTSVAPTGVLNMDVYKLLIHDTATISNYGTIITACTDTLPIPANRTWGGTIYYNGSSEQELVAGAYHTLSEDSYPGLEQTGNVVVNNVLNLDGGIINTGIFSITARKTSGGNYGSYVNGMLIKMPTGTGLIDFPIGDATGYTPVTLTPNAAITSGSIGMKVTAGAHPNDGTSGLLNGRVATRYWTITNSDIVGPTAITPKFNYRLTDIPGGNNSTYVIQKYSSGAWLATPLDAANSSYATTASAGIPIGSIVGAYIVGNSIAAITGTTSVCAGATTNLSNITTGGTWSANNLSLATVDASGIVTGVAAGDAIISYNTTSGSVTATVTVKDRTVIGTTINSSPACVGTDVQLTAAATGVMPVICSWTGPNAYSNIGSSLTIAAATVLASGTYTMIATGTNGCRDTATTTVVVNPVPLITTTSNSGPVCAGATLSLSTAASGGTNPLNYLWAGPAGFVSPGQFPVVSSSASESTAGSYTIVVTDANNCRDTATTAATVYSLPAITSISSNGNSPLCAGTDVQLMAAAIGPTAIAYSWTGPNAYSATGAMQSIATAGATATGSYTLVASDDNGCRDTAATFVTVNPKPTLDNIGNNGPLCAGLSLSLHSAASGGAGVLSYSWSGPGRFTSASHDAPVSSSATDAASGIYMVIVTDTNNCRDTATTTAIVYPLPVIDTISSSGPICAGDTLILNSNANSGTGDIFYSWAGPNGYSATGQTSSIANAPTSASGIYTVTVSDEHSCQDTAHTASIVNELPAIIAISNSAPVCEEGILTLATTVTGGAGVISYSWTGPNGFASTSEDPTVSTAVTTDEDGIYTLTVTDASGCVATGINTTGVTVYPLQPITGSTTVFFGQTITLSNPVPGGTWSTPMPWTAKLTSLAGMVKGISAGIAQITYTTAHGCDATYTVTVLSGLNVCVGQSIALSDGVSGGTWTSGNGSIAAVSAATGVVTGVSAGRTIIMHRTVAGIITTTVTVNPLSATAAVASVCQGQTITLVNNTAGGGTWYSSNTAMATVTSSGVMSGLMSGAVTVYYTPVAGCVTTKVITIIPVNPIMGPSSVCMGQTINVSNSMAGGIWSSSAGALASVSAAGVVKGVNTGTPRISYIWPTGCQSVKTLTVSTLSAITGGTPGMCQSGSMTLANATPFGGVWSSSNTGIATVSAGGVVKGTGAGAARISFTTNADGCVATRTVTVNACRETDTTSTTSYAVVELVDDLRLFPNPNRGVFALKGHVNSSNDKELNIEVVNMLGQVIYQSVLQVQYDSIDTRIELQGNLANGIYLLSVRNTAINKVFHFVLGQ